MKAAVRPIQNAPDVSVLHRIEVNVVDMALEIGIVANGVLPIAALPDAFFPF
ncbi:MAG TPA: hypothetical protein VGO49_13010 [Bradyrhizobium sp.]|jgi:hypothetical protein|nr:hypothetical protein [Bradyrhizobium sp.]